MMQNPHLGAIPDRAANAAPGPGANNPALPANRNIPDIVGPRGGWYPRWWLLSAFLSSIVVMLLILLWNVMLCRQTGGVQPPVCNYTRLPSVVQVPAIWIIFLGFWLLTLSIGIKQVELPASKRSSFGNVLRSFSQFGPVRALLIVQGCIALLLIIVMWWRDQSTPLSFAFLCIIVFLAHCSFSQQLIPEDRRTGLLVYAFLALCGFFAEWIFKTNFWPPSDNAWPLLCVQGILLIVGVIAFFRRSRAATQRTAQDQLNINIDRQAGPLAVLRRVWPLSRIWPPRPIGAPGNAGNQDNH